MFETRVCTNLRCQQLTDEYTCPICGCATEPMDKDDRDNEDQGELNFE